MAARNRLFPASRRTVTKPETHFNARCAIDAPVFTLARSAGHKGISLKVHAHYLIDGQAGGLTLHAACRMQTMPEWAIHHLTSCHVLKHAGNAEVVPLSRELVRQLAAVLRNWS